jgi:hypothetical protein
MTSRIIMTTADQPCPCGADGLRGASRDSAEQVLDKSLESTDLRRNVPFV